MLAATAIGRLRIRSSSSDQAAVRLAVARRLQAADLSVPELAPSAILLLRRMSDPLPGRLASGKSPVAADPAWQAAARSRLSEAMRAAARPIAGRIAGEPSAVLFRDQSELLACWCQQLQTGLSTSWWHEAVARFVSVRSLSGLFEHELDLVPAVVTQLARWGSIELVLAGLTDVEALTIAAKLVRSRDAPALSHIVDELVGGASTPAPAPPATPSASADSSSERAPSAPVAHAARHVAPPWRRWEVAPLRSSLPRQLLAGVSLGLHAAPGFTRSASFATLTRAWVVSQRGRGAEAQRSGGRTSERPTPARGAPAPPSRVDEASGLDAGAGPRSGAGAGAHASAATTRPSADARPRTVAAAPAASAPALGPDTDHELLELAAADAPWSGPGDSTALGGVWLLLNLLEHLQLPDVFEPASGLASSVGAWGVLESMGRALCSLARLEAPDDALWTLLARLDGREPGEPPRDQGLRVDGLSLPPTWLAEHPRFEAPPEVIWDGAAPAALSSWLALIMPFIRWRLCAALGYEMCEERAALRELLAQPARVHVAEAHIDVVFPIDCVRLPVRLAGLDRSPGWVASLGRVVLVHFE